MRLNAWGNSCIECKWRELAEVKVDEAVEIMNESL